MKKEGFMLSVLPDGDIVIRRCLFPGGFVLPLKVVRHRSFNLGDSLEQNIIEEFRAMQKMEEELEDEPLREEDPVYRIVVPEEKTDPLIASVPNVTGLYRLIVDEGNRVVGFAEVSQKEPPV